MAFNPDQYLASQPFDPDEYLKQGGSFDPDAYLSAEEPKTPQLKPVGVLGNVKNFFRPDVSVMDKFVLPDPAGQPAQIAGAPFSQQGENILRASGEFSMRERFSDYVVQAQQTGWDGNSGAASAHVIARSKDEGVARYRPTVVLADGPNTKADAKRRADWQRNTSWGRGQGLIYTVNGWRHADGLWAPNRLVRVVDPWLGIDGDRLIMSVQLMLDEQGSRTELRVMPREAADLVKLPDPKKSSEGWQ